MAEPSTSAGVGLTALAVATLGPLLGPYAVIVFGALAGAMWPLSSEQTTSHRAGGWLLLRVTTMAVVLTFFIAKLLEQFFSINAMEALGPIALLIGALGNNWRATFKSIGAALRALLGGLSKQGEGR